MATIDYSGNVDQPYPLGSASLKPSPSGSVLNILNAQCKPTMNLKLKPSSPSSPGAPFSWDNLPTSPSVPSPSESPLSPPTLWVDAKQMKIFGAEPLRPEFGLVRCKDCDKSVQKSAFADHLERCRVIRAGGKKGAKIDGKERDADSDDALEDESSLKKKKAATKITKGRAKGPIDLDRQCGVINDKNLPCSRALTCKSHAMGAKRAVQGRSKPYDELLNDFNKERNPNYVEPPKRQSKAERKEKKEKEKAEKKRMALEAAAASAATKQSSGGTVKKGKKTATTATPAVTVGQGDMEDENMDDVDSEAELDSMVKAVRNAQASGVIGVPLAIPYDAGTWFVARRERLRNCKDLLASALMPRPGVPNATGVGAPARVPT